QSDQETKVIIYPIPSHGRVNVELPSSFGAVDLDLLDMSGKVVLRRAGVTTRSIELKDLTPGLYALQLYSPEYGVLIKKIVVMK
ncbi:MAG TPA: T9SS type A sorting domain-containing protein, partial [Chitinophagaceae bacterium]|nr:T9SS type A sorting domain-containing protein [Chitinophagaceae bacterium]